MGFSFASDFATALYDRRLRKLRWLGIDADTHRRVDAGGYRWRYDVDEVGFKYHMNDVQAAIGLGQLPYVEGDNLRRGAIAALYRHELGGVPGLELLRCGEDRVSSFHLFVILAEGRDALLDTLKAHGVDAGVHYARNDAYPMYRDADLPNTESFWRRAISLPMHVSLSDDEVRTVAAVIRAGW